MSVLPRFVALALAILVACSCNHIELPVAPTRVVTAITITSLTITPVGGISLLVGTSAPITSSGAFPSTGPALGAFAIYSDGTGKYVEATWTTSDPTVLIVDASSLIAKARGTATLTANAEGKSATEAFVVEPGIPGTWAGTYVVDSCEADSGSMLEVICLPPTPGRQTGLLPIGAVAPISFQITQSGTDLSAVAAFGDLRGTLLGNDRGQNLLTLKGELTNASRTTLTVIHWDAQVQRDVMDAFIGFEVRMPGLPGHALVGAHFATVTRR